MTKPQLEKKLSELEEELHIANNSVDYWSNEAERFCSELIELRDKINSNTLYSIIKNCTLNEEIQIN